MKKIILMLFTIASLSANASVQWLATHKTKPVTIWSESFRTPEGMPVYGYKDTIQDVTEWGYQVVYNCETDGGASDHVITKARWENWIVNSISKRLYFPKNWVQSEVLLGIPDNLELFGDDSTITHIIVPDSVTTSYGTATNNYGFISYGSSNFKVHDLTYSCGNNRLKAIWLFNPMKNTASDIAHDISFDRVHINYSYASPIKGGDRSAGQTTHIVGLSVTNSEIDHIGNPANPYNIIDGAVDSAKCHGLDLGSNVWDDYIVNNKIHDCSGDGINTNLGGADATTKLVPEGSGRYVEMYNQIWNTYSGIVHFGPYAWYVKILYNKIWNWTNEGGFGISIDCMYSDIDNNDIYGFEGRTPLEIYGIKNHFGFGQHCVSYLGRNPDYPATWKINTASTNLLAITAGFKNEYYGTITYDSLYGVSPKVSGNLRGIGLSGTSTVGYQPSSWEGKSYPYGYDFECTVEGVTEKAVFSEIEGSPHSEVHFGSLFKAKTSCLKPTEKLILIYSQVATTNVIGWVFDGCTLDNSGSPSSLSSPNDTTALIGFASFQRRDKTRSLIKSINIIQTNNAKVYIPTRNLFESAPNPRIIKQGNAYSTTGN